MNAYVVGDHYTAPWEFPPSKKHLDQGKTYMQALTAVLKEQGTTPAAVALHFDHYNLGFGFAVNQLRCCPSRLEHPTPSVYSLEGAHLHCMHLMPGGEAHIHFLGFQVNLVCSHSFYEETR